MKRKETQNVEFKQSWRDEFLKEICGFANAKGDRVNDRVKIVAEVLLLVENNPGVRSDELAQLVNKSLSTVSRSLRILKADGKIEFRGAPKNGGYFAK